MSFARFVVLSRLVCLVLTVLSTLDVVAQTSQPPTKPQTQPPSVVRKPAPSPPVRPIDRRLKFRVTISAKASDTPVRGRLLVLMSRNNPQRDYLEPQYGKETESVWIAARDISTTRPGDTVEVDPDQIAFPGAFSKAPMGDYWVMAMLDRDHDAAYRFFTPGDLVMKAIKITAL